MNRPWYKVLCFVPVVNILVAMFSLFQLLSYYAKTKSKACKPCFLKVLSIYCFDDFVKPFVTTFIDDNTFRFFVNHLLQYLAMLLICHIISTFVNNEVE